MSYLNLKFGLSPTNWRQRPDMTTVVDWEVKQHTNGSIILSRRLTGEPIVYPCSGVRRCRRRCPHCSKSFSSETVGPSKPKFMWSILRQGESKFV